MKLFIKCMVNLVIPLQVIGCSAMDVPRWVDPEEQLARKMRQQGSNDQSLVNALVEAASLGKYRNVEALLEFTNVNGVSYMQGFSGKNALIVAVDEGHFAICALLIEHGANVYLVDKVGNTPLILAASKGDEPICRLLLEYGADVSHQNVEGNTALMCAAEHNRANIVQLLLTAIPLDQEDKILKIRASLLASQIALKKVQPTLPKDMHRLISQEHVAKPLIDRLIQEQMDRVVKMLAIRNRRGHSALDIALGRAGAFDPRDPRGFGHRDPRDPRGFGHRDPRDPRGFGPRCRDEALVRILDCTLPESREAIRKQIRNNIMHLLFDERPQRTPIEEVRRAGELSKLQSIQHMTEIMEEMAEEELDDFPGDMPLLEESDEEGR